MCKDDSKFVSIRLHIDVLEIGRIGGKRVPGLKNSWSCSVDYKAAYVLTARCNIQNRLNITIGRQRIDIHK